MDDTEIFYALQAARDIEHLEHDAEYAKQAAMAFFIAGIEHARQERIRIRHAKRVYLTRFDLLRNPRFGTPWQHLYKSQNDRAFITTMGFDTSTFNAILDAGFTERWNTLPLVEPMSIPKERHAFFHVPLMPLVHWDSYCTTSTRRSTRLGCRKFLRSFQQPAVAISHPASRCSSRRFDPCLTRESAGLEVMNSQPSTI
jgi:hypothetical protein